MIHFRKLLVFLVLACFLVACGSEPAPTEPSETTATEPAQTESTVAVEAEDYVTSLKLDMYSDSVKQVVTVKNFVDGDTVHFHVPTDVIPDGVLKARFLAVNTPESTGKIEEYGKAAANFTKEKLSAATSILIESDGGSWDKDSTGDRYLVWVWYKTSDTEPYRNLNLEILQNGLARANSTSDNRYGSTCVAALNQAKQLKLNLHSGEKDPDYYYGDAVELTLQELRLHIEDYAGVKVAFNGVITTNSGTQGVYVEELDPESGLYCGMYLYYGHGLNGHGLDILSVGNRVRIVGTVQYYEGGGTWQISDLNYRVMQPDDPGNIQKLEEGCSPAWMLTDPATFASGEVTLQLEDSAITMPYAQLVLGTSVKMKNLKVLDAYTTEKEGSSSDGAMTLYCEADGVPVTVRTIVLLDAEGKRITAEHYLGKTIDVKGIVDLFDGDYQIKVFTANNITINE